MISSNDLAQLKGASVHGAGGEKLGKVVDVYESADGPEGTFVTVATGLFGRSASFVPLAQASMQGKDVVVPYDKSLVKDAPRVDADSELTPAEEDRLHEHYRRAGNSTTSTTSSTTTTSATTGTGRHAGETSVPRGTDGRDVDGDGVFDDVQDTAVGRDTSGLTTDDAMTRSEEQVAVGTRQTEVGRARLRKRIVSEDVQQTVPVSHEEVRIQREPITEANADAAYDGPALSEEEHEVVLHGEEAVVTKQTVPVERVRLDTETVTEQQTVNEQVRKEQIEPEPPRRS